MKKIEISQHARYTCTFCGKVTVKRHSTGIWDCKSCKKTVAGGAYTLSYVADPRPAIRIRRAYRPASMSLTVVQHPGRRCHQVYHPSSARDRRGINGLWHQGGSRWSSMSAFKFAALGNSVADNEEIPSKSSNDFHPAHREANITRTWSVKAADGPDYSEFASAPVGRILSRTTRCRSGACKACFCYAATENRSDLRPVYRPNVVRRQRLTISIHVFKHNQIRLHHVRMHLIYTWGAREICMGGNMVTIASLDCSLDDSLNQTRSVICKGASHNRPHES